jgi:hypothetical protein
LLACLGVLLPTGVLGLRALFHGGALSFDGACNVVMLPLGRFECCLRLGDRLLATMPLLDPCGLFLPALAFVLPLGSLIIQGGLADLAQNQGVPPPTLRDCRKRRR